MGERSRTRRSTTRRSSTTRRPSRRSAPTSLDEVDPELLRTYEKLGIPLDEQKRLAGVAVDAVFDSVSVATTFKEKLAELGHHLLLVLRGGRRSTPSWSSKYLGSVVPYTDNFFATLNSAVFTRRLVLLHPEGRALPDGALDLLPHQRGRTRASSSAR